MRETEGQLSMRFGECAWAHFKGRAELIISSAKGFDLWCANAQRSAITFSRLSCFLMFICVFICVFHNNAARWLASQLIWLIIKLSFGKQSKPLPRNLLIANTQRIGLHCSNKINDTTMMCRAVCTIHIFLLNVNFRIYCTHNPIGVVDWESHHSIHIACLLGGKVCPINEIIMIGIENSLMQ